MGCLVSLVVCFLSQVFCFLAVTNLLKMARNTYALALASHAVTCLIGDCGLLQQSHDLPLQQVNRDADGGDGLGEVEGVPRAVPEVDGEELAEERGRLP